MSRNLYDIAMTEKNQKPKGGVKMRKPKLLKVVPLVFLMVLLVFSFSYSQKQKSPFKADKLELTYQQKEKMRDLRTDSQKERIKLKADLKIARLELKDLMREEKPVRREIYRKIEEMGDLKVKLQKSRVDQRLAMKEILTPEQLDKLQDLKRKRFFHKGMEGRKKMEHRGLRKRTTLEGFLDLPQEEGLPRLEEKLGMLEEEPDI
ncbi:MAG: hypothetical protein AMJ90_04630 [candidate division Zixibacteria bacterium SM23_73_2]|nr:MAG: hypothetical protein AMJ90_04630 [candidate division Zixibacteria bacterium SM23_73_2]